MRTTSGSLHPGNEAGMWIVMADTEEHKSVILTSEINTFRMFLQAHNAFQMTCTAYGKTWSMQRIFFNWKHAYLSVNRLFFRLCKNRFPHGPLCKLWEHFSLPESLSLNSWIVSKQPDHWVTKAKWHLVEELVGTKGTAKRSGGNGTKGQ